MLVFGGVWLASAFQLVVVPVPVVVLGLVSVVAHSFGVCAALPAGLLRLRPRSLHICTGLWVFFQFWEFLPKFFLDFARESV